jgi:hypothetical protein
MPPLLWALLVLCLGAAAWWVWNLHNKQRMLVTPRLLYNSFHVERAARPNIRSSERLLWEALRAGDIMEHVQKRLKRVLDDLRAFLPEDHPLV